MFKFPAIDPAGFPFYTGYFIFLSPFYLTIFRNCWISGDKCVRKLTFKYFGLFRS